MNTRSCIVFLSFMKDPMSLLLSDRDWFQMQWGWEGEIHPHVLCLRVLSWRLSSLEPCKVTLTVLVFGCFLFAIEKDGWESRSLLWVLFWCVFVCFA